MGRWLASVEVGGRRENRPFQARFLTKHVQRFTDGERTLFIGIRTLRKIHRLNTRPDLQTTRSPDEQHRFTPAFFTPSIMARALDLLDVDVRIVPSRIKGAEDGIMSRNQSGEVIFFPLVSSA
jgi:hypothetical protein